MSRSRGGSELSSDPIVIGIVLGLVVGKTIGVLAGAWSVTALTRAELLAEIGWRDVVGVAMLSGVGFTVSLLIAELAFDGVRDRSARRPRCWRARCVAGVAGSCHPAPPQPPTIDRRTPPDAVGLGSSNGTGDHRS